MRPQHPGAGAADHQFAAQPPDRNAGAGNAAGRAAKVASNDQC